jgi:hypothetical protein
MGAIKTHFCSSDDDIGLYIGQYKEHIKWINS